MTSLVLLTVVSLANLHKRPETLACYYVTSYWQAEWVKKLRWKAIELPPPTPNRCKTHIILFWKLTWRSIVKTPPFRACLTQKPKPLRAYLTQNTIKWSVKKKQIAATARTMGGQVTRTTSTTSITKREERSKKEKLKRKASEVPTTTTAKIKKTEESIKPLRNHLERNTCPKPLKYFARANIPADEQFKKKTLRPLNRKQSAVLSKP